MDPGFQPGLDVGVAFPAERNNKSPFANHQSPIRFFAQANNYCW
jgi:hypothetical protein